MNGCEKEIPTDLRNCKCSTKVSMVESVTLCKRCIRNSQSN